MDMRLTEEDVKTQFITPNLQKAGWQFESLRMEYAIKCNYQFSDGRIEFVGQMTRRAKPKKADYLLFCPNTQLKLAIIEAKSYEKPISEGLSQAKSYAKDLDVPFAYSSNGKGFIEYDFSQAR